MLLRALALALAVAGCSGPDDSDDVPECTGIDTDRAMIVAALRVGTIHDVADQGEVELISAPQGGHILLVGARFPADRDCQVTATGALRDLSSQRVIGLEQRAMLLARRTDGWAIPMEGLHPMPNVAVCPSAAAAMTVYDNLYRLEIQLATRDGDPITELAATIRPTCASEYCRHDCMPLPP